MLCEFPQWAVPPTSCGHKGEVRAFGMPVGGLEVVMRKESKSGEVRRSRVGAVVAALMYTCFLQKRTSAGYLFLTRRCHGRVVAQITPFFVLRKMKPKWRPT